MLTVLTRKRRGRVTVVATGALLVLAACGSSSTTPSAGKSVPSAVLSHQFSWGTFHLANRIVQKLTSGQQVNIVVDNQGTGIPVFGKEQLNGTNAGCSDIQHELSAACQLAGPPTTDNTAQLAGLQTMLSSGQVDCLALEAPEPGPFVNIVNQYIAAGVPVFTENADVPDSHRFAFYALNETAVGVLNGKTTAQVVQQENLPITGIAVGSGSVTGPWAQDRMNGFEQGYKEVFPNAKFFNSATNALETGLDFTNTEVVDSVGPFLKGNPSVNLFFHTDQGVEGVALAIKQDGLTGKVWTSGYNVDAAILASIQAGTTLVTVDQGFDTQARDAVNACANYLAKGQVPANPLAYTQPYIITKAGGPGLQSVAQAEARLSAAS